MLYFIFLYASLASPVWAERESASASLLRLIDRHPGTLGPRLESLARDATEPEVRARVRLPLALYTRWRVNSFVPNGCPVWPICDAFPVANPVVPFGLADVRCKCTWPVESWSSDGRGGPQWTAYRRTTERRVRELLREGMSHDAANELVSRMWVVEQRHRSDCGIDLENGPWCGGYVRPKE